MDSEARQQQSFVELEQLISNKESENANLKAQLADVLEKFNEVKLMAERRAKLLHHVMEEYNGMTKEYELMKFETNSMQSRALDLKERLIAAEAQADNLEQSIQFLELENNELRRGRIVEAPSNVWYGECTHSCSRHPRSFPKRSQGKRFMADTEHDQECGPCTEAEEWAEDLIKNPPTFSDSLRRHYESTLPIRPHLSMKPGQDSEYSTLQKSAFEQAEDFPRQIGATIGSDRY